MAARTPLVGNRLVLVGAIVYLLEWVAIAFLPEVPSDAFGANPDEIVDAYSGASGATALAAGWLAVVLLGRVLFIAAVRRAFHDSGRPALLLDLALGAMIVSVAIEIVSTSIPAAGAWLADNDGDSSAILAIDAAASVTFVVVYAVVGVSALATGLSMVSERLFPAWIAWLGVAAGVLLTVGGITASWTLGDADNRELGEQPAVIGALAFWIWILATGIVAWRRRPA
jgi:Domain of unknown function (DUF4386)